MWFALVGVAVAQDAYQAPPPPESVTERPLPPAGWTSVPGPYVHVHGPVHRIDLLMRLAQHGATATSELSDALRVPVGGRIDVYLAETAEQFVAVNPGSPPGYADATAYPSLGLVVLRDPRIRVATDEPLEQVLSHELVHVLLGRAFAPAPPPTWLQEGAAQLLARQDGPQTSLTLRSAALGGNLPSLGSIERGFPRDALRAQVAYAASLDFLQHLSAEYDTDAVPKLVEAALYGRSLDESVADLTGQSLDEVERRWRAPYEASAGPWGLLTGFTVGVGDPQGLFTPLLGLGGVALLVGGLLRRRRFRRRLAEMEAEERLVDDVLEAMRRRE